MIPLLQNKRPNGQRGAVTIMFAIFLVVLLGFAALALDLGRINLAKVQLQNAADAAALGGAGSLVNSLLSTYDWYAAEQKGLVLAQHNIVNGEQISQATIEAGYWNSSDGFRHHGASGVPVTGDVPAVRATVALTSDQNNGPLKLFFAPFLGFNESNISASAIAAIYPPAGGVGMFPFAFNHCIAKLLWDSNTNSPKLDSSGQPITFKIQDPYPSVSCYSGEWTTFDTVSNSVSDVIDLMDKGNNTAITVGDLIWIQPGTKTSLYKEASKHIDETFPFFIVANFMGKKGWRPVIAIIGFKITDVNDKGNNKYIEGHFTNPKIFPGLIPGNGSGVPYGAFTPPYLVQ